MDANESSFGRGEEDRQERQPQTSDEAAQSDEGGAGTPVTPVPSPRVEAGEPAEPIMARLPRSRPKPPAASRKAARPRAARASKPPRDQAPTKPRRATKAGGHRRGATSTSARSRAAGARTAAARGKPRDPAVFGPAEEAPGLPRLALDGAIEAAKLPMKVSAHLTFRALDAVSRGLRRR